MEVKKWGDLNNNKSEVPVENILCTAHLKGSSSLL